MKRADDTKIHVGSGNVFADLGLPDAEDQLIRSNIAIELRRLIKERKLKSRQPRRKRSASASPTYRISCVDACGAIRSNA